MRQDPLMAQFPADVVARLLADCRRHCCVCAYGGAGSGCKFTTLKSPVSRASKSCDALEISVNRAMQALSRLQPPESDLVASFFTG